MFYCTQCKKEVLLYSLSYSKDSEEELSQLHQLAESEGKILLLNPNPIEPYKCPICGNNLILK
ncbi:MAG: hypothetical protein FK734_18520 [Asgard group archaeon]|nr:hypothetical protein [Asgard group archaeon]